MTDRPASLPRASMFPTCSKDGIKEEDRAIRRTKTMHVAKHMDSVMGKLEAGPGQKTIPSNRSANMSFAAVVSLLCLPFMVSVPSWAEDLVALVRAVALAVAAHYGGPCVLHPLKQNAAVMPYTVLFESVQSYMACFVAAGLFLVVRVQNGSDDSMLAYLLTSTARLVMAVAAVSATRYVIESLYSTRLLKNRCEQRVLENQWQHAVVERLHNISQETSSSRAPVLSTGSGPFEFDAHCAMLIQRHAKELDSPKTSHETRAMVSAIFDQITRSKGSPIGARTMSPEDLDRALPKEDAQRAWAWLHRKKDTPAKDGNSDGGSDSDSADEPVDEIEFRERIAETRAETLDLASSICEFHTVCGLFRSILQIVHCGALSAIFLALFFPAAFANVMWTLSSILVAGSFMFGSLARDVCESLALILFIRPFDVGDRVCVAGAVLIVVEVNLLTTAFVNPYNELVWLRNSQIFSDSSGVRNFSRSEHSECAVELDLLAEDCSFENIEALEKFVRDWCEERKESWLYDQCGDATACSGPDAGVLSSTSEKYPGIIRWRFRAVHKSNLHVPSVVKRATSRLLLGLLEACKDRNIRLQQPATRVIIDGENQLAHHLPQQMGTLAAA
eukprot:TRINITY_DN4405_c0_g1_i6.p1 TRINITY_DN4405_c0_g1~~TRINITY_DN4405_c0_g1_i6.p1  ORF type:complete len:617 (+),score=103.02 TRINITY_DN4405_c0_g1_i6:66-1916(+)